MFATQVLPQTLSDDDSQEDSSPEIIGYLIVKETKHEVKKGETKIGRDSSMCSIAIEDFTVSKVHAVIESEGIDDTFIYDVGSTNQTKLGKKVLKPHCRYKLDNETKLTLGNISAIFMLPPEKTSETNKSHSDNNPLDELGDIFDLATQVTTPDINATKIPVFEKSSDTKVFKNPTALPPKSVKESKNIFDEVTQCRLDSQKTCKTELRNSLFESTNIFNLSTQCQLYNRETQEKSVINGSDKMNSLLNDGQDDVLCVFMSLHSPKEQNNELLKEIKTEVEDLCEVFDAPTQIQPVIQKPVMRKIKPEGCNKFTSTPYREKMKSRDNALSDNSVDEDDFIKTQEFNAEVEKVSENVGNQSQEDPQLYLGDTLDDIEEQNNDEDLILTQTFECNRQNSRTTSVITEREGVEVIEDLMATQIYNVDKEIPSNKVSDKTTTPQNLPEDFDETIDFTQRDDLDDFIQTQVFEDPVNKNLERQDDERNGDNEEDLIATQPVNIPINKAEINKTPQKSRLESSRESSPDLLGTENTWKDTEDFISTQLFEVPGGQTSSKSCEHNSSSSKERNDCNNSQNKLPVSTESSGDETESDLEIIFDKTETRECIQKPIKTESEPESITQPQNMETEDNESNSSYIFELGHENQEVNTKDDVQEETRVGNKTDSDETDCEEIAAVIQRHPVKQEPLEKIEFEDTQVLTLTLPDNYEEKTSVNIWMTDDSPRFESGFENGPQSPVAIRDRVSENGPQSPVAIRDRVSENGSGVLEDYLIPSKIKKIEVGVSESGGSSVSNSGREVESPLKRPLDTKDPDVVPIKKSKTELLKSSEKKLLKLVQAHDMALIQPNRTRNSIKTLTVEAKTSQTDSSVTNEHQSSRRKSTPKKTNAKKVNGDIKSYLTTRTSGREKVKETSPKEKKIDPKPVETSSRILRSSSRNSGSGASPNKSPTLNVPIRKSRRLSRTKNEYFTGSTVNIVFTGFCCESLESIISELGGKREDELSRGEVVVADKVRRTVKFLCAIGLGLPITSPEWLLSCKREQKFLNPWKFILKDEDSEEKYNFELKTSLERSRRVKLLEGFSVFATKSTKPPVKDLLAIVECCGGTPLLNPPNIWPKKTIIVSCVEDKQSWPSSKFRNVKIVHYEFILGGVLRQKIDFKTYQLR